jgi:hypothetical protein
MNCPRCHHEIAETVVECPFCHIVVAQYIRRQQEKAASGDTPDKKSNPFIVQHAEEKKGPSIYLLIGLLAVLAGYYYFQSAGHKPVQAKTEQPAPDISRASDAPAPTGESPAANAPSEVAPPQDSSVTDESNDANASAESFKKGDKKIRKLLHATAPLRIGSPERVLDSQEPPKE